jgi:hypothetical protein
MSLSCHPTPPPPPPHPPHFLAPFAHAWQGLLDCPQIIIADGVSIAEKSELKKGRVTQPLAARYSEYLQRLAHALEAEAAQLHVQVPPPQPPAPGAA